MLLQYLIIFHLIFNLIFFFFLLFLNRISVFACLLAFFKPQLYLNKLTFSIIYLFCCLSTKNQKQTEALKFFFNFFLIFFYFFFICTLCPLQLLLVLKVFWKYFLQFLLLINILVCFSFILYITQYMYIYIYMLWKYNSFIEAL